ncbi:multidrug resistance-associated protein 5 [Tanacetum coccineum]
MFDVEETFGRLTLYLDHLDMNLSEYLSQAITYDMHDLISKKIGPPKKRYFNDFFVDEMVDWAEMEVETEGYESDDDNDYQLDKSVDYLSDKLVNYISPGEDELLEFRNRMKANRKAKAKAKDKPDEEMNEPNEENNMHADNVRGETFEEHDIYISLKTADKDGITEDPFISVEKHMESFSLWHERSREVRVVAKCGQRPPRVSDPKKAVKHVMPNVEHRFWHVIPAGGNLFEVRSGSEGFIVDEGKRTCSCRMWQLSGLPCVHATKSMYSTVLPPKSRKMPGRPRKKRIRAIGEGGSSTRVSKTHKSYQLSQHNKSSCKELVVEQTPKPKGVVGRPRKKQPVDDFEDVDVVQRGPARDEGASRTRRGAIGSRGRGGAAGSRGDASRSICRGAGGSSGASGSRGRGTAGSRRGASGSIGKGVGGSKRKPVSTTGTQKRQGKK